MKLRVATLLWIPVLLALPAAWAQQSILLNGSMELGEGPGAIDPMVADKWTEIGGPNIERSGTTSLVPPPPGHALKAFGDMDNNYTGAWQEVLGVNPNDTVLASVWLFSPSNDKLGGTGEAGLKLEFFNSSGVLIPGWSFSVYPFNASSPPDTWVAASLGPYTAPAGTVKVRATCRLKWTPPTISGAVYWDDARVNINSGPNSLLNGDFETAGHGTGQSPMGIDDWMGFNDQEKSGDFAYDGSFSLKLGVREAYSGLYQNTAATLTGRVTDTDHLYMTAYVWNPSGDPLTGTSRAGLKLEWNETPPPWEENLTFDSNDPQDTWVPVTYATTVPAEATIARIVMIANDTSTTNGPVYVDSASAIRSSAPGVNQLLNESFEYGAPYDLDDWIEFGGTSCAPALSFFDVPAYEGDAVLRLSGSCVSGISQEIPVAAGEGLTISAYFRSKSTDPFNDELGPVAGVKVEWVVGSIPPIVDIGGPSSTNTINASAPRDTWIPLYIDFPMPAGTYGSPRFVNLIEKGTAMSGHVYFDLCDAVVLNWTAVCTGDLNCDGSVSFKDINPFVQYLSNATAWQTAYPGCDPRNGDINGDGSLYSFKDINPFVALLSSTSLPIPCP